MGVWRAVLVLLVVIVQVLITAQTTSGSGSVGHTPASSSDQQDGNHDAHQSEHQRLLEKILHKYPRADDLRRVIAAKGDPLDQKIRESKQVLKITEMDYSSKLRVRLVTLTTDDSHKALRAFVGNLHERFPPSSQWFPQPNNRDDQHGKIQLVVYGLKLSPVFASEIKLWKNVEFIEMSEEFLKSHFTTTTAAAAQNSNNDNREHWRPIVIKHAVDRFGKVLYMDPHVILSGNLPEIEKFIATQGSFFVSQGGQEAIAPNYEMCNMGIQGYLLGSSAYRYILVPQVDCSRRACNHKDLGLLHQDNTQALLQADEDAQLGVTCSKKFIQHFRPYGGQPDDGKVCNIVHTENFLFTTTQLTGLTAAGGILKQGRSRRDPRDTRNHIALGFPTTSKGNPNPSVATIPFFTIFLPTFLSTISANDGNHFLYHLSLGYDQHDPFFDNAQNQQLIYDEVKRKSYGKPVIFTMVRLDFSKGWVVYLWNGLFQHAIENGADYFYQLNDDIRFITSGWSNPMVSALSTSRVPNVGAAGPQDTNNAAIFTQSFVSKRHYEIFGTLYPAIFENWYSDDWMTYVYKKAGLIFHTSYQVHNNQNFGTRYVVCSESGSVRLNAALEVGYGYVDGYLREYAS